MDLCSRLIMNVSVSSKLLLKTQNPTEGDKINMVVSTIHHPMYLISELIIEVGGVELCKHLFIPVILETHDIGELKAVTDLDHLVNILHLSYLGLPRTKDSSGIEVGMKLIPKHVVDAQILAHYIGIYLFRLFDQLPTLGIVDDWMLTRVIWYSHKHLPINLSNVGSFKLS